MDNIQRQVRKVWRRLALRQFLFALGWCWFGVLSLAVLIMTAARIHPLPTSDRLVLAIGLALGFLVAVVVVWRRLPLVLTAAWEIDRRFDLKERVSSTLAMNAIERASGAGQALLADTESRLKRLNLDERFSLTPPRPVLLPLLPGVLAMLVMLRPAATPPLEAATIESPSQLAEVQKAVSDLRDRLSSQRHKMQKSDLVANELLKKIEDGTKEILAQPNREKALVKLNQLENQLKDRQTQLGGIDTVKRQLEQLKSSDPGPADTLAKAMARGDFKQAADALEKLKQHLAKSELDEKQKKTLSRQLDQLQRKLDKMAEQECDMRADLQKRADQLSSAGDPASAQKLQDQIDKMMQNSQSQSMQQLADALGKGAQAMKQGDKQKASDAMQNALDQLKGLAKQSSELATVDSAMRQIASARDQMNGNAKGMEGEDRQGQGKKKEAGQAKDGKNGDGERNDMVREARNGKAGDGRNNEDASGGGESKIDSDGDDNNVGNQQDLVDEFNSSKPIDANGQPGDGIGRQRGRSVPPEKEIKGKFYDSSVKQNVAQGAGIVTDMVEGPNLKGHALAEIQKESTALQQGSTDPLSGQRLPKEHSKFARDYFDRVREDVK